MKNILTLGNGFVANHLPYEKITERIYPIHQRIEDILIKYKPDVLINCIGKTGRPNIDWCESNKIDTIVANINIPIMLAQICNQIGIHFIHLGSGCIYFDKDKVLSEEDEGNPKSFYSKTKYACDLAIGELDNVTVARIRMPISSRDDSRNLINKLRGYKQIIDIPNSVTFMDDFSRCIEWIIDKEKVGIYNVVNDGTLTAAEVMGEYQKYFKHTFDIISGEELDRLTIAKRSNCILSNLKLSNAGFEMGSAKESLINCMKEYVRNINVK